MDEWAEKHSNIEVICQSGETEYIPKHMQHFRMLDSRVFMSTARKSELIVAHAGMGSVFTSIEAQKPILLVPRYASLGEHTTNHQIHTAEWLQKTKNLTISYLDEDLSEKIEEAKRQETNTPVFAATASEAFLSYIRSELT